MATLRDRNLDVLRGLGAVAVVLLHAPPLLHSNIASLKWVGWTLREICQIAVPMFFLISGHFAGIGERGLPGGARSLSRILRLYLPWFLVYLAIDLLQSGRDVEPWIVLRRLLGFGMQGAATSGYQLWFLPAMIWGTLALRVSCKWLGGPVPALCAGFLVYAYVGWTTFPDQPFLWDTSPHEGLSLSLPFLALGYMWGLRAKNGAPPLRAPAWVLVLGVAWLLSEGLILGRVAGDPWLVPAFQSGRIVLPVLLLSFAAGAPAWVFPLWLARLFGWLATASTGIYVMHLAVLETVPFERIVANGFLRDNLVRWVVAVVFTGGATVIALRRGPRWIKPFLA